MTRRRFFASVFGLGASLAVAALPTSAKPQSPTIDLPMISGKIDADLSYMDELHNGDFYVPQHIAQQVYDNVLLTVTIHNSFDGLPHYES